MNKNKHLYKELMCLYMIFHLTPMVVGVDL